MKTKPKFTAEQIEQICKANYNIGSRYCNGCLLYHENWGRIKDRPGLLYELILPEDESV